MASLELLGKGSFMSLHCYIGAFYYYSLPYIILGENGRRASGMKPNRDRQKNLTILFHTIEPIPRADKSRRREATTKGND